jgi:hypothetical protein
MTRAIILTTQRSGSTFLEDALERHPEVKCYGEILIAGNNTHVPKWLFKYRFPAKLYRFIVGGAWLPVRVMNEFYSRGDQRVKIFKAMYNHIANPWTLGYLERNTDIRILHLRRHNVLKQYVSRLLLAKPRTKRWQPHSTKPVPAVGTFVDPQAALRYMRATRAQYEHYERVFAAHQRLPLVYEEMIAGQGMSPDVEERVCEFLGISVQGLKSPLVKLNPDSLRQIVTNYEAVAKVIQVTEFADLLDR